MKQNDSPKQLFRGFHNMSQNQTQLTEEHVSPTEKNLKSAEI